MTFDLSYTQSAMPHAAHAPESVDAEGYSWIHLLPAGENGLISTRDGRGPYKLMSPEQIIANSKLVDTGWPVDENHAIDKMAAKGGPTPACGEIVEMQARADGIWGRVRWNDHGRKLIEQRAYKWVSPVIAHTKDKTIAAILRASLVPIPNLRGMTSLHSEDPDMGLLEKLRTRLKLGDDADEAAVMAALEKMLDTPGAVATQAQLDTLGAHLGLDAGASIDALTTAAQSVADDSEKDALITALQSSVKELGSQVTTMAETSQRDKAEAYIDGELKRGRAGLNASVRDQYVSMHMKDPAGTETLITAMPVMTGKMPAPPKNAISLQSADPYEIAAQARAYQKKQADAGIIIDIATAVTAIEEGKS